MSEFEDFICRSEFNAPRTITYGKWSIVSTGEGGNRFIYVRREGTTALFMWVDAHTHNACFVHSVKTKLSNIYIWLDETCDCKDSYRWSYYTWEKLDKLMQKLVDYIRHAR